MKVLIEGDLDQVCETLNLHARTPRQQRLVENRAKRETFIARRKVVVEAFKKARSLGADHEITALLEAVRRTGGVTEDDIKLARQILTEKK